MVLITNFLGSKASLSAQKAVSYKSVSADDNIRLQNDDMLYKNYIQNIVLRHT